jgi:hypothetical protein
MNDVIVRRLTGLAGVAIFVAAVAVIPLYFLYPGPPPVWAVLTRGLINIVSCILLLVFIVGIAYLIRRAEPSCEWVATLANGVGLTFVTLLLVAISLEVGGVLRAPDRTVDPTIDGPLAAGATLFYGSIGRALTCVYLIVVGFGIQRTRIVPGWVARFAYVIAAINLAFVPSLYFGADATRFYSAIGWGNTALVASLIGWWTMATGATLLRRSTVA